MKNSKVIVVLGVCFLVNAINGMHDADPLVQPGYDIGMHQRVSTTKEQERLEDINVYSLQPGNGNSQPQTPQGALVAQSWKTYCKRKSLECGLSLLSGVFFFSRIVCNCSV